MKIQTRSLLLGLGQLVAVLAILIAVGCEAPVGVSTTTNEISKAARGAWAPNVAYVVGDTVTYQGTTYTCRQSHTSLVGWEPPNVLALWLPGGSTGATPTPTPTPTATPTATPTPATTPTPTPNTNGTVVYTQNGMTLTLNDKTGLAQATKDRMVQCFFNALSKESARFNTNAPKSVPVTIDPAYTGVAYTLGAAITVSYNWMNSNPYDDDVITHEVMHVVQAYTSGSNPGWAVEGLADYARYKYGLYNSQSGWSLPNYAAGQSYTDAYRVTARFLAWIENHIRAALPVELDATMRAGTYSSAFWTSKTGYTVDQLWSQYAANPAL